MNCFNIKEVQSLLRNKFIHETPYNKSILLSDSGVVSSLGSITNRSSHPTTKHGMQVNLNPFYANSGFSFLSKSHRTLNLNFECSVNFFGKITLAPLYTSFMVNSVYASLYTFNYTLLTVFAKLLKSLNYFSTTPKTRFKLYYNITKNNTK